MIAETDEWVRRVGLLLGFEVLPKETEEVIKQLANEGLTAAESVRFMRHYLGEMANCPDCKGGGRICVGNSGQDVDGNAPIIERCETCDGSGNVA